ncbi:MAG TPA: hypothetical protein VFH50_00940 [Acidimicrobiales bacterium]|nr:hypothetical protein [Acidimicrobiales bacterium]
MTTTAAPSETRRAAGGDERADPPVRRRAVLVWVVPVVLAAVTVAVHVVLARHMRTPIIHADEFGYLMGAHFMARGGSPTGAPYYPGYSALLVPLWWISRHPLTVYRWALDVNAVLAGATAVLSFLLARRLAPRSGPLAWGGAAVVVSAYPAVVMYSNLAESENLLVPGFLAVALLVLRAVEVSTPRRWAVAAGAAGLLYAVHGRAVAVAAALVLTAAWVLRPWRARVPHLLATASALLAALAASELWIRWVTRRVPGRQLPARSTAPSLSSRVATAHGLQHVGAVLSGEGLYLMAAAAPLLVLGVAASVRALRRRPGTPAVDGRWHAFLLLSLLFGAVVAAVFLATGNRIDDTVYGRYVEVFAVPVMLVGAVTGARLRERPVALWRSLAIGAAVAGLLAMAVSAYWGGTIRGTVVRTNVFGLSELVFGPNTAARLVVAVVLGVAVGALVAVVAAYRLLPVAGVIVAVGAFVAPSVRAYADVVGLSSANVLQQVVPDALTSVQTRFGPVPCVAWDSSLDYDWQFYNTRLLVPDTVFPVFDSRRGGPVPCSSGLVVSGRAFATRAGYPGARLVMLGNDPAAVWALPGALQSALDRAGWLLPAGFPAPLPDAAASGTLRLVGTASVSAADVTLPQRATRTLWVSVSHTGGGAPWPNATSVGPVPQYAVRIAVAWFQGPARARQQVAAGRADLPVSLLPGRSERARVTITPQAFGSTGAVPKYLAPGAYDVEISLIQESVRPWDATVTPIWLHVTVTR